MENFFSPDNKYKKNFYTEKPEVFGATVQNKLARDLCNLAILMCLDRFLKRKAIIPIQITKS